MKTVGILSCIAGALLGFYALSMDVSVKVNYSGGNSYGFPDRVNNLGLMSQRQNYLTISGILILAGVLFIVFSNKSKKKIEHKYKEHLELAKKAEYKGELSVSINHYLDTLFHLENDYKHLSKNNDESRKKLILSLKNKVEELKTKVSEEEKSTNSGLN